MAAAAVVQPPKTRAAKDKAVAEQFRSGYMHPAGFVPSNSGIPAPSLMTQAPKPTAPAAGLGIGSVDSKRSPAAAQPALSRAPKPTVPSADVGSLADENFEMEAGDAKRLPTLSEQRSSIMGANRSMSFSVSGSANSLADANIAALAAVIASGSANAAPHPVILGKLLSADPRDGWQTAGIAPRQHVTAQGLPACTMQSIAEQHGEQVTELRSSLIAAKMFGSEKKHLKPTDKLAPGEIIRLPLAMEARNILAGTWVSWKADDELVLPVRLTHYADGKMQMFAHTNNAECKFCVIAISHSCFLS